MKEDLIDPKEKLLMEYMLSDKDVFIKSLRILSPDFFEKPLDRVAETIIEYFNNHFGVPPVKVIEAETGVLLEERTMEEDERSYFLEEFEAHCRQQAMTNAILESVDLIQEGDLTSVENKVRNALMIRLDDSIGTSLMENVVERIEATDIENDKRYTGITAYDETVGPVNRGEFHIVYAVSSGGKSVMLANIGYYMALQGLDVCVISLELNESLYSKRLDSIITDTSIEKHRGVASDILESYKVLQESGMGEIVTKKMKYKTRPSEIRAYLMEYRLKKGKFPDVLIVDYMHIMGPDDKKASGKHEEHEDIAFSLRDIMTDIDAYGFSAGQINREGQDVLKVNPSHVAGGISVVSASDSSVALVASEEDIDNNQMQLIQLKVRNFKKSTQPLTLYRNPHTLRITSSPMTGKKLTTPVKTSKIAAEIDGSKGKSKLTKVLKRL